MTSPAVAQTPLSQGASSPANVRRASFIAASGNIPQRTSHVLTETTLLPEGTRPLINVISLPESTSASPGWSIKWWKYRLTAPTAEQNASRPNLVLPKITSGTGKADASPSEASTSASQHKSMDEWILATLPNPLHDPFELAKKEVENGAWRQYSAATQVLPIDARLAYIETVEENAIFERFLWVFDLDSRIWPIAPLSKSIGSLQQIDTGSFRYATLFEALVDPRSEYPSKFTAKNVPSAMDLKNNDSSNFRQSFVAAIQHHVIKGVIQQSGQKEKWNPVGYTSALYDGAIAVEIEVSFKWEGLVITPSIKHVNFQPWTSISSQINPPEGQIVHLFPVNIQAQYIRMFGEESKWTLQRKYSNPNKLQFDLLSERQRIEQESKIFRAELGPLNNNERWLLVNWKGRKVIWPQSLAFVQSALKIASELEPKPSKAVLPDVSIKTGQYIEELALERDRARQQESQLVSATSTIAQPLNIHHPFNIPTPQSLGETGASPQDILNEIKLSIQPSTVYPTPPENSSEIGAKLVNGQSRAPKGPTWTDMDLFPEEKEERWDRYVDRDTQMHNFTDIFTNGITEDDFDFFDEPASTSRTQLNPGADSLNPFSTDLYAASPAQLSMFASPGFGDLPSPPKQASTPRNSSVNVTESSASPGMQSLVSASPLPEFYPSPYKSAQTPFTPAEHLPTVEELGEQASSTNGLSNAMTGNSPSYPSAFAALDLNFMDFSKHFRSSGKFIVQGEEVVRKPALSDHAARKRKPSINQQSPDADQSKKSKASRRQQLRESFAKSLKGEVEDVSDSEVDSSTKALTQDRRTSNIDDVPVLSSQLFLMRNITFHIDSKQKRRKSSALGSSVYPITSSVATFFLEQGLFKGCHSLPDTPKLDLSLPSEGPSLYYIPAPSFKLLRYGHVVSIAADAIEQSAKLGLQALSGPRDVTLCLLTDQGDPENDVLWLLQLAYVYQVSGFGQASLLAQEGLERGLCSAKDLEKLQPAAYKAPLVLLLPTDRSAFHTATLQSLRAAIVGLTGSCQIQFVIDRQSTLQLAMAIYSQSRSDLHGFSDLAVQPKSPLVDLGSHVKLLTSSFISPFVVHKQSPSQSNPHEPQFSMEWPVTSFDILERNEFLHVSYRQISSNNSRANQLAVIITDGCAESYRVFINSVKTLASAEELVASVWECVRQQLNKTTVAWRVVIEMVESAAHDMAAWHKLLSKETAALPTPIHVTLCALTQASSAFLTASDTQSNSTTRPLKRDVEEGEEQSNTKCYDLQRDLAAFATFNMNPSPFCTDDKYYAPVSSYTYIRDPYQPTFGPPSWRLSVLATVSSPACVLDISIRDHLYHLTHNLITLFHYGAVRYPSLITNKLPWHLAFLASIQSDSADLSAFNSIFHDMF